MLSASICDTVIWEMATQGIGAVVVVVRHRSYGPAALTQQRHDLAAHAADPPGRHRSPG